MSIKADKTECPHLEQVTCMYNTFYENSLFWKKKAQNKMEISEKR